MGVIFGNTAIGSIYLGSTKISEIYKGSAKVFPAGTYSYTPTKPYLLFEFSDLSFRPSSSICSFGTWHRHSSIPNQWYWEGFMPGSVGDASYGWPLAFCRSNNYSGLLIPSNLNNGTCKIVGSGNFNYTYDGEVFQNMDRTFSGCTGLTEVSLLQTPNIITNVGGCFQNCTNITDGMLDQYNYWSTYNTSITNHSGTFTSAGENTVTGLAELDQIPSSWGGNQIPVSTLMSSSKVNWKGTFDSWQITSNAPTWANVANGMYLFTSASVSSYAGVSMNRSRISKFNGLQTTQSTYALYFYPCFMQHTTSAITWAVATGSPNGSLAVGAGNTDMPGTLDYSTFGPFTNEYGTFDSNQDVYFCFLVTNVPIASWNGLTDAYGVLYNSNFKTDGGFRWFF